MKNTYLALVFLLVLPSCYKKHIYEQYKKEKHGTVHYQPSETNLPIDTGSHSPNIRLAEIISDGWLIGNATYALLDSIPLEEQSIYYEIENPSFETGAPTHSLTPDLWENCGDYYESAIDIHAANGWFQVRHEPAEGFQYAGMVVRDNNTHESIGQILEKTLYAGQKYAFSFYVARAENYISLSKTTMSEENFNQPARMRIKVGYDCKDMEIVGQTDLIASIDWEKYTIIFEPSANSDFLIFEAFFENEDIYPYNGNVLLDNISPIYELPSKN